MSTIVNSNKIFLKRKALATSFYKKNRESIEEGNWKIGASIRNNDVCRGLTFSEEEKYLPTLLGVQPKNDNWHKSTTDYWNSISKNVPEAGLELEIGFTYRDIEGKTAEQLAKAGEAAKEEEKYLYGSPINVVDYILYRYCLVYSHVANTIDDINKSQNIRFYLYSKKEEIKRNSEDLRIKNKAYGIYLEMLGNRTKVENVVRLFGLFLQDQTEEERDIILSQMAVEKPLLFVKYATDDKLDMKAFILNCITAQKLKRIENTDTIMFGDNTILGGTLDEAVGFLSNDKNSQVLNTLKVQMGVVKSTDTKKTDKEVVPPVTP